MKRRWTLGSYELKINPKSNSSSVSKNGETNMTVNGVISSNAIFYESEMAFTIDVYDKPTDFGDVLLRTTNQQYISITKSYSGPKIMLLQKNTNLFDIYDINGNLIVAGRNSNFGGSICAGMTAIDGSKLVGVYPNGDVTTFDENGAQISKYTYTTNDDVKTSNSIAWDGGNYYYLLCKYGKIMRIDRSNGAITDAITFDDYAQNKSNTKEAYRAIHFADFVGTLLAVVRNNEIVYFDTSLNVIHGVGIEDRSFVDISNIGFTGGQICLTNSEVIPFTPNLSGVEVNKIKKIVASGAFVVTDENNISRTMFPQTMSVNRLRNKKDSRYEINIRGKIV